MGMVQKLLPLGSVSHPPKTAANVFMTGNHGFTQEPGRIWHCPANTSSSNPTPVLQSKTCLGIGEQGEDANDLPEFPVLCFPPQGACLTSASSALTAPWGRAVTITPVNFLSLPLCSVSLFLCLGWGWGGARGLFSSLSPFGGNVAQNNLELLQEWPVCTLPLNPTSNQTLDFLSFSFWIFKINLQSNGLPCEIFIHISFWLVIFPFFIISLPPFTLFPLPLPLSFLMLPHLLP